MMTGDRTSLIGLIIQPDQTGFMPVRHMSFNMNCHLNILYSNNSDVHLIKYMMCVLKKFGFGLLFANGSK